MPLQLLAISPPSIDPQRKVHSLQYQPLPTRTSIRLLRIHPLERIDYDSDLSRPFRFSVITKDLDDCPEFDALSYTWGNPHGPGSQQKDSPSLEAWSTPAFDVFNDDQPVSVTTNLYTALLALRVWSTPNKETGPVLGSVGGMQIRKEDYKSLQESVQFSSYIWIDQICINQADIPERNSQVQLMGRIYRQARSVHAWLGSYDDSVQALLEVQECLLDVDFSKGPSYQAVRILEPDSYKANRIPYISQQQWFRLYAFLNRSWFRRSWIVQEIGFAKRINFVCGLVTFNYLAMSAFHRFLDSSGWYIQLLTASHIVSSKSSFSESTPPSPSADLTKVSPTKYPDINFFAKLSRLRFHLGLEDGVLRVPHQVSQQIANRTPLPLSTLIRYFRPTQASDAKDKIYALIGLSKEFLQDTKIELIPDYHKSVRDVYIQTVRFLISSTQNLDCFSLKESEMRTRLATLPSWVPDFSTEQGHNPLFCAPLLHPWTASAKLGSIRVRYLPGEAIEVQGVRVGSILRTHDIRSDFLGPIKGGRCEIRDVLRSGLIELLQLLPEVSHITIPPTNQSHSNSLTAFSPAGSVVETSLASQSRLEVLCRTLLHDHFDEIHPAPAHCIDDILADMKYIVLAQLGNSLCYLNYYQNRAETGHVDWESLKDAIGRIYTIWKKLTGLCPYDMDRIVYPPGYEVTIQRLGDAWNHKPRVGMDQVDMFCRLMERRRLGHHNNVTSRRLAVRSRSLGASMGRALFATCTGYLGSGLESVRVGDEVWILAGASVPCVLRPTTGGKRYRLVGDAYVHGLMDGNNSMVTSEKMESVVIV
ncbi:heterokaryon incompatibility protein-domain-containing protein [Schizothecium vesticola]|uniref:Heterokaryon incompatibility protein-domain-containing protein n=1 Tax=Schizothecium vesticola TaxID=314040 RepID=A0AA40BRD7_9PEZI|nr:heterokaryon incompatibility protein-domain-containing protein [Schizothecium vesticola]